MAIGYLCISSLRAVLKTICTLGRDGYYLIISDHNIMYTWVANIKTRNAISVNACYALAMKSEFGIAWSPSCMTCKQHDIRKRWRQSVIVWRKCKHWTNEKKINRAYCWEIVYISTSDDCCQTGNFVKCTRKNNPVTVYYTLLKY